MKFINITTSDGETILVNPDHIVAIFNEETNRGCCIQLSNGTEIVCDETAHDLYRDLI